MLIHPRSSLAVPRFITSQFTSQDHLAGEEMPKIPIWLIGPGITTLTITPQTVGTDGTFTAATPVNSFIARLKSVKVHIENEEVEKRSITSTIKNWVPIADDFTLTLEELMVNDGTDTSLLVTFALAFRYGKLTFGRGGKTWTWYGKVSELEESGEADGFGAMITMKNVDIGAANPTIA
jgi:hypothetical protein